jgi:hypothetical protein
LPTKRGNMSMALIVPWVGTRNERLSAGHLTHGASQHWLACFRPRY